MSATSKKPTVHRPRDTEAAHAVGRVMGRGMFEEITDSFADYTQTVEAAKRDPDLRADFIAHLQEAIARFETQLRNPRRRRNNPTITAVEIRALLARARWILLLVVEPGERS